MSGLAVSLWPLTAREAELGALSGAWRSRHYRGVVVFGPAGVGKTRLAEEFLARVAGKGVRVRRVTASSAAAAVPLGAVAHLVPAGVDLSDPVAGFAQVARVVAGPDRKRRWALLVDDLHLLDAASAVLLRQLMDAGVVRLVATVRSGEPLGEATGALLAGESVYRVDLEAFTEAQAERVLQAGLAGPVARRTVQELFTASGGNALYLGELVRGALEQGALAWDGEIWSLAEDRTALPAEDRTVAGTVRLAELIGTRLAAAPPASRGVLELLAWCGPVGLVDAQAQTADDPDVVAGLEQAGLVRVAQDRARTKVVLAHPLYGETLRAHTPVLRRRRLLLDQVERIEAHGARRRDDALRTAGWRLAATGTADPALLTRAASLARYAHDYTQALALLEALPEDARSIATRLLLGEVLFELDRPSDAERVLTEADEHAVSEREVLAVTMARTVSLFWSMAKTAEALEVNDRARGRVTSERGLRLLRYNEGWMRIPAGEPARGLALLEDMPDDIRDDPAPEAWLAAAFMKPVGLQLIGRVGEAVAFAEHAYRQNLGVDDRALYPHPAAQLVSLTAALRDVGRVDEARETGERGYAELTAASALVPATWMATILGELELFAGHPVTARRWCAEAAGRGRRNRNPLTVNRALNGVAACAGLLGEVESAEKAVAEARAYPSLALFYSIAGQAEGWLEVARGDLGKARALLADFAAKGRTAGMLPLEAWMLTDIARLGGAHQVQDRLAELATLCDGTVIPARAHLAAALAADDPEQLTDSGREWQAIGADLLAAEAFTTAATAYRKAGDSRRATATAQLAHACVQRCEGARTPLLAAAHGTTPLTARERDVALLAAHGTPSQDIAEKLHLSVRTVENHLQHAYAKLGVTNRRELALTLETTRPHTTP